MNTALVNTTRIEADTAAYFFIAVLLVLGFAHYGRQFIEWLLMKMHEFFIQNTVVKL